MSKRRNYFISAERTKAGKISLRVRMGLGDKLDRPFTWTTLRRAEAILLWLSLDRALDGNTDG